MQYRVVWTLYLGDLCVLTVGQFYASSFFDLRDLLHHTVETDAERTIDKDVKASAICVALKNSSD